MARNSIVSREEQFRLDGILLANLHQHAPQLRELLETINRRNNCENLLYRYYSGSCKVFELQGFTEQIAAALRLIAPEGRSFCENFEQILTAGTHREFATDDNAHWPERVAPITHAFFHARYFLEMAVKYEAELKTVTDMLPYGWAALLCLYEIR